MATDGGGWWLLFPSQFQREIKRKDMGGFCPLVQSPPPTYLRQVPTIGTSSASHPCLSGDEPAPLVHSGLSRGLPLGRRRGGNFSACPRPTFRSRPREQPPTPRPRFVLSVGLTNPPPGSSPPRTHAPHPPKASWEIPALPRLLSRLHPHLPTPVGVREGGKQSSASNQQL